MKRLNYIIPLVLLLSSCSIDKETEISKALLKYEMEYEKLCINMGENVWLFYSDSAYHSLSDSKNKFADFLSNQKLITEIKSWNKEVEIKNDTLKRRLEIWNNILNCAHVDFDNEILNLQNELEKEISEYSPNDSVKNIIENKIKRLILLRNSKSREIGFGNYAHLVLQNTGIDTTWFYSTIGLIDSLTKPAYKKLVNKIKQNKAIDEIKYKDISQYIRLAYQIERIPEIRFDKKDSLMRTTLSEIGFNIEELPIDFKIKDMPPGIGGFGNCIDIPNDFKAIVKKELSFKYWLHEIGHGLQWLNVKTDYPVLKGYEWCKGNSSDLYSEAMAETVSKFCRNSNWLLNNGYSKSKLDSIANDNKEFFAVKLRFQLINSLVELEMYKNPDLSPGEIENNLYEKYLFIKNAFSPEQELSLVKLGYVSYPIYEQNYLFADIISWQIHENLKANFGEKYYKDLNIEEYLIKNFWSDGEFLEWKNRVERGISNDIDIAKYIQMNGNNATQQ
ncbi:MAG: hypothetical protein GY936_04490 [Ignavibacteriae bacterium]|nr:hypothetical protein [Ignavibacteriota bacterium]